jgi:hypothetical protein
MNFLAIRLRAREGVVSVSLCPTLSVCQQTGHRRITVDSQEECDAGGWSPSVHIPQT